MIAFLRLFRIFRDLERDLIESKANHANDRIRWDSAAEAAQQRFLHAEERADRLEQELIEKLSNSGDALSLRFLGRRMYSKAPVEAPPEATHDPVTISAGAGKRFAGDVARQSREEFFKKIAQQVGVLPKSEVN